MRTALSLLLGAALLPAVLPISAFAADAPAKTKKIVLIGMNRDHGPGEHEYAAGLAILAECLKQTPGVEVEVIHLGKGFPNDAAFLDKAEGASTVVCFLRRAGDLFKKQEHRARIEALLKQGTGFVCLHWAVEGDKKEGEPFMAALGGYYEPGYSDNPHNTTLVRPADGAHPIARGWKPFEARDEFYFKIRLLPDARPVVLAAELKGHDRKEYKDQTIGWVYERKESKGALGAGRSFGFTGCHFHVNFGIPEFRRLIVNGILWTAGIEVPESGAPVELTAPVPKVPPESKPR
jgi:type 1 glutamine amidotransferase